MNSFFLFRTFAVSLCAVSMLLTAPRLPALNGGKNVSRAEKQGSDRVSSPEDSQPLVFTLSEAVNFALIHNPKVRISFKDIEIEAYRLKAAKAARLPRLDFTSGLTHYQYQMPLSPITGPPPSGFPEFDDNIYDAGVSFKFPLYRGGRLIKDIQMAEIGEETAKNLYRFTRQDLIYNLTAVYYKIFQMEHLLEAHKASVKQLEAHAANVSSFIKAGTASDVEFLKTDAALSEARAKTLTVKNQLESAHELLKTLMGMDDMNRKIAVAREIDSHEPSPDLDQALPKALAQRPDFLALQKKRLMARQKIESVKGKRWPEIILNGEYSDKAGESYDFKDNWFLGVRLALPLFEGGIISSEIRKEMKELEKVREEERFLRLFIIHEIKDALLDIENADQRAEVGKKGIQSAQEVLRIESLKYETGAGTSSDVIDAESALLRAQTDYFQSVFDREVAMALLRKAMGEDRYGKEEYE